MSVQFIGMIGHRLSSDILAPNGPVFDNDYIARFAQAHEQVAMPCRPITTWA
ncbi:hypothetical protein ACK3BK_13355 [Pseudomonas sp. L7]|uniref:hypothetical protein n=1 Tax=Pseudomonas sp. L7 TaxID=3388343 RepID=UPI0039852F6C